MTESKRNKREITGVAMRGHQCSCEWTFRVTRRSRLRFKRIRRRMTLAVEAHYAVDAELWEFMMVRPVVRQSRMLGLSPGVTMRLAGLTAPAALPVLRRWLSRQPAFMTEGVSLPVAAEFLRDLGMHPYSLEEVASLELLTDSPVFAQAGGVLLPLPWVRLGLAQPRWFPDLLKDTEAPSLVYRRAAPQFWAERLLQDPQAAAALAGEPDITVREKVERQFGGTDSPPQFVLKRFTGPQLPSGQDHLLDVLPHHLVLMGAHMPDGIIARSADGTQIWKWSAGQFLLERPSLRRVTQQPVQVLASLLAQFQDPALALDLSIGPLGERLLAELRLLLAE